MSLGPQDTVAAALDLGSTSIKFGRLASHGAIHGILERAAPAIAGSGVIRESDPLEYLALCQDLLSVLPAGSTVGLCSQRSSFVLWERSTGRPLTKLISWMDTRAQAWCENHRDMEPELRRNTGLLLSAHYAGPKLAQLLEHDPALRTAGSRGEVLFGTLDSYLAWHGSSRQSHIIEYAMAARTLMLDLCKQNWSTEILQHFGIPQNMLPMIMPSRMEGLPFFGHQLKAIMTDQGAACAAVAGPEHPGTLVNLGTGGFVLSVSKHARPCPDGYLQAPICRIEDMVQTCLEGTINGIGRTLDEFPAVSQNESLPDDLPDVFCLPESAGMGAPHWRPRQGRVFSQGFSVLSSNEKHAVVVEGVLFRVREIVEALSPADHSLILSGGHSRLHGLAQACADILQQTVQTLDLAHGGLHSTLRLAAGMTARPKELQARVYKPNRKSLRPARYLRWLDWSRRILEP